MRSSFASVVVAASLLAAGCGGTGEGASGAADATNQPSTSGPDSGDGDTGKPLGDATTTTAESTTTTTPPDPAALWGAAVAGAQQSVGPATAGLLSYGLRSDGRNVELMTWNGSEWVADYQLDFQTPPDTIDQMWLTDVTGDGVSDAVVAFHLGSDQYAEVFVPDGVRFRSVPIDNGWVAQDGLIPNPQVSGSKISGLAQVCEPSCAEGPMMSVAYPWNGSALVATNPRCNGLRPIDYGKAVAMCTEGEVVRRVQEALNYFGYMSDTADGQFGPLTRQGVIGYQREIGQYESGWLSPEDAISLIEYFNDSLYYEY